MDSEDRVTPKIESWINANAILGLLILAILAFFLLRTWQECRCYAADANCTSNIKQIVRTCRSYAQSHQNQLPPDLVTLQKAGLISPKNLICPAARGTKAQSSYLYFGAGLKLEDLDEKTVLLAERERHHGKKNQVFLLGLGDNHIEVVGDPGDLATIARSHGWKLPGAEKNATSGTNATHATSGTPQAKP
jgi:competence protein ComGC